MGHISILCMFKGANARGHHSSEFQERYSVELGYDNGISVPFRRNSIIEK